MIYRKKQTSTVSLNDENNIFLPQADVTVKDSNYGITSNVGNVRLIINNNITVAFNGTAKDAAGINISQAESQIFSSEVKKTTKVSFKSDSSDLINAYGWLCSKYSLNIGGSELLHNFNISGEAVNGTARSFGFSCRGITSNAIFKSDFTVSAKGGKEAYAYAFYISGTVDLNTLSGKFTISANSSPAGEACGIYSTQGVFVDNITGSWNITGKGKIKAYGIRAAGKTSIGNFAANMSVSGYESRAFYAEQFSEKEDDKVFEAALLSGRITVTAADSAYGISSCGNALIGDMSAMNMKVTGKAANAYGIHIFSGEIENINPENLIIAEGILNVGSISVTAAETACGIYVYDAIAAFTDKTVSDKEIKCHRISGSITAKGKAACGIEANSFTRTVKKNSKYITFNTIYRI